MNPSTGHICFAQYHRNPEILETVEFYEKNGEVFRAPISNAIMPDGFRVGRWECDKPKFDRYRDMILGSFDRIITP